MSSQEDIRAETIEGDRGKVEQKEKQEKLVSSAAATISDKAFLQMLTEAVAKIRPVAVKPPLTFEVTRARRDEHGDLLSLKQAYYVGEAKMEDVVDSLDKLLGQKMPRHEKPTPPLPQGQTSTLPRQAEQSARPPPWSRDSYEQQKDRYGTPTDSDFGVIGWMAGSKKQNNLHQAKPGEASWASVDPNPKYDDETAMSAKTELRDRVEYGNGQAVVSINGYQMKVTIGNTGLFSAKRADAR